VATRAEVLADPRGGARSLRGESSTSTARAPRRQPAASPRSGSRKGSASSGRRTSAAPSPSTATTATPRPSKAQQDADANAAAIRALAGVQEAEREDQGAAAGSAEDAQEPAAEVGEPSTPATGGGGVTEQVGGGLLAFLVLWPLAINLLKGGPPQMLGWVKAKLVNEPYSPPGAFKQNVKGQTASGVQNAIGGPPPTPSGLPPPNPIGVL
jgi:hypothetical protein